MIRDLRSGGYFIEHPRNVGGKVAGSKVKGPHYVKNTLVANGANWFLRTMFRGEAVLPATYYLGLTNASYTFDGATLAGLAAGEPVANGYARQALNKNTTDWTVQEVNGIYQALSKMCSFTCTTAPWTVQWLRMFLCDASAGTSGNVIAVSGPAPAPRNVIVGGGPEIQYAFYLRG